MNPAAEPAEPILNDKLYTLDATLDTDGMRDVLAPFASQVLARPVRIEKIEIDVLRRRNKRCVQRYRLALHDGTSTSLIGKVFKAGRGEAVYADMQELWRRGFARSPQDPARMPEPLGFLPELCLLVQEEVPGVALKDTLTDADAPQRMRQLARVLAKLHRCGYRPGPPFRMLDHLMRCHPKVQLLSLAFPDLEPQIDHIVSRALALEKEFEESSFTAIHGDFHMGQVHVEGEGVYLIDFDALSFGDPAADLGNVLVFLKGKHRKIPNVPVLVDTFLTEYFQHMDRGIEARIPLYEAVTHLRRACKKLRLQRPRWEKKVRRMLGRATEIIDGM